MTRILFIILQTGTESSGANSCTIFRGKSFETPDLGFFAAQICKYVSYSVTDGGVPGKTSFCYIRSGKLETRRGLYLSLNWSLDPDIDQTDASGTCIPKEQDE